MNEQEFINEVSNLGIDLTDTMMNQLNKYYEMLVEKNKVVNLTRIVEHDDVYLKHFYDSLTLSKVVNLNNDLTLCDVGTGAGFPGLVLKIVFPNLKITLLDSLQKRINFLNEVIEELKLTNIETVHARSEEYGRNNKNKFDIVTSRAVANLNSLLPITMPLVKQEGVFIAMKANIDEELKLSQDTINKMHVNIKHIESFNLIKEKSVRNLVVVEHRK